MPERFGTAAFTERFEEALLYAARHHARQRRKGSRVPYVGHVLGVASLVIEDGGGEDEAIAALLHDAVEDAPAGEAARVRGEVVERFGADVARIVEGCTDADTQPKPPWWRRKLAYVAHVRMAPADVRRVSLADKLYNARSIVADYRQIGDALWERFRTGAPGTLWYYLALADAFEATDGGAMAEELRRVLKELLRLVARPAVAEKRARRGGPARLGGVAGAPSGARVSSGAAPGDEAGRVPPSLEIERRFLCSVDAPEALAGAPRQSIRQAYLTAGDPAVRIRQLDDRFIVGLKLGKGLVRREFEDVVSAREAAALFEAAGDAVLEKERRRLGPWEVDVYRGRLAGLVLAEVELAGPADPLPPAPPGVRLRREVTEKREYTAQALARLGAAEAEAFVERARRVPGVIA